MPTRDRLPRLISVLSAVLALLFALLLIAPAALATSPAVTVEQVVNKRTALSDCETRRDSLAAWLKDVSAAKPELEDVNRKLKNGIAARERLARATSDLAERSAAVPRDKASLDAAIERLVEVRAKCDNDGDAQACAEAVNLAEHVVPPRRDRYVGSERSLAAAQSELEQAQQLYLAVGGDAGLQALKDRQLLLKGKVATRFPAIVRLEGDMSHQQRSQVAKELNDVLVGFKAEQEQLATQCVQLQTELAALEAALQRQQAAQPAPRQDASAGDVGGGGFSDSGDVAVDRGVQAASQPTTGLGLLSGGATPPAPAGGGFSDDGGIEVNAAGEVVDQSINRCSQLFTQFSIATGTPFKPGWARQLLNDACTSNCSWCSTGHDVLNNVAEAEEQARQQRAAQAQAAEAQRRQAAYQRQQRALREQQQQQAILDMFNQTMRSFGQQTSPDRGYRAPPPVPNAPGAGYGMPGSGLLGVTPPRTPQRTPPAQQPYRPYQPIPEPVAPRGPGLLGVTPPNTSSIPGRVPTPRPNAECGEYFSTCE